MDDATSRTLHEGKLLCKHCYTQVLPGKAQVSIMSDLCMLQVYQDLCKKHPTFRERSENADLAVSLHCCRTLC